MMQAHEQFKAGLGALALLRAGLGAFEVGQKKYVTTKDQGRLGSLLIQPNSADTGKGTAIGYFPKNTEVEVLGQTFGKRTFVGGNAWSLGMEAGGSDEPLGATSGWVNNAFLTDTPGGDPWVPPTSGGGGGGEIPIVEPVSLKTTEGGAAETDYTPWILAGVGVVALGIIGVVVYSKKRKKKKR